MKLTGKAKQDFEKWFEENLYCLRLGSAGVHTIILKDVFEKLPDALMYGAYVDFFDSVGVDVDIMKYMNDVNGNKCDWQIAVNNSDEFHIQITRHEARTKAIEKANELYNAKS